MLFQFFWNSIIVGLKVIINGDDFLKIEFLEIDIEPSDQEINQITLL